MTEKHKLEPAIRQKLITGQRKTSKKTYGLDELGPDPAIQLCDAGQQTPFLTAVN